MTKSKSNTHFLIAEDDEVDILALKRILIEIDQDIAFSIAHDGNEALAKLRENAARGKEKERMIVLLDLNMPRMNGHEFLDTLRADPAISDTQVFVLSTSTHPSDVSASYKKHVAGYIPKDRLDAESFRQLFDSYLRMTAFPEDD
ncbi:MAG: hypothetical protein CMK06_14700 [Ponticaulis sp.]|nr:hypothetical protein [Ponticaulis sp.]|tara:strand:+ start:8992 stop:9426 length:435 start_codon:yes stop_codon:yes gene_type:complete